MGHQDTAIVNVPLAKRGCNFDREIERSKTDAVRARKAKAAQHRADQVSAKAIVAAMPDAEIDRLSKVLSIPAKKVRVELGRMAHWQPMRILRTQGVAA